MTTAPARLNVTALGVLDLSLQQDFGPFDAAQFQLTLPPMISANTSDGAMRLVIGRFLRTIGLELRLVPFAHLTTSVPHPRQFDRRRGRPVASVDR